MKLNSILYILLSLTLISTINVFGQNRTTDTSVKYNYMGHELDKKKLIYNLRQNVLGYIEYNIKNGFWNDYERLEFIQSYNTYMEALDDSKNPYRFYTDEFGSLHDNTGKLNDNDPYDFWYDSDGKRISEAEYNELSKRKKKRFHKFEANREFVTFMKQVLDTCLKHEREMYPLDDF